MALAANDDVVVDLDADGFQCLLDGVGHLDVVAGRLQLLLGSVVTVGFSLSQVTPPAAGQPANWGDTTAQTKSVFENLKPLKGAWSDLSQPQGKKGSGIEPATVENNNQMFYHY